MSHEDIVIQYRKDALFRSSIDAINRCPKDYTELRETAIDLISQLCQINKSCQERLVKYDIVASIEQRQLVDSMPSVEYMMKGLDNE